MAKAIAVRPRIAYIAANLHSIRQIQSFFREKRAWHASSSITWTALTRPIGTKKVLDNVHLSFYPDAKIGVLGPNGSGKSTILRIMAGLDKEWNGEAWLAEGATVGYLAQEPQLDPTKTVFENVMEGVARRRPSSIATTS